MKPCLRKRELVAMLMESPMYFDLRVRERLELLRDLIRRWSSRSPGLGPTIPAHGAPPDPAGEAAAPARGRGAEAHRRTRMVVGYFPPPRPATT
jgi:hypothetical protein